MATLYIVATPIGNLGDITLRAIETFRAVDLIACEDTRRTLQLLNHLGIKARLVSCRARNEAQAAHKIIEVLEEGRNAAYASDAGTPGVSDPGSVLVRAVVEAGHEVVPIPGASAFASLLSIAGGLDKTVVFEGFLSPKPGRRRSRLKELLASENAFVLYESPFRVLKLLKDLADLDTERYVCIGREMTKLHEEYLRGSALQILQELELRDTQLGEFAVYISGKKSGKLLD
ncbi:16S rRNA (cytidine(1402)-2'-O)-methyltransferase [Treponema sp.]